MLPAIVISPDRDLCVDLERLAAVCAGARIQRYLPDYPSSQELSRLLSVDQPEVLFVGTAEPSEFFAIVRFVADEAPDVPVIAFGRNDNPQLLLELMAEGVREYLVHPIAPDVYEAMVTRTRARVRGDGRSPIPSHAMYSFLPAKPGTGCTTLASGIARALVREHQVSALLTDLDLTCGMIRFLHQLPGVTSIADAVDRASELDDPLWTQLVSNHDGLHILHAGGVLPGRWLELQELRTLLHFVRRRYRIMIADHSGNMERYSIEVLHESRQIYLVSTPEAPAVHLLRERYRALAALGLGERVSVLLNRAHRGALLTVPQIEEEIGLPVLAQFPNDYQGVHEALSAGKPIRQSSPLGRQLSAMAATMAQGVQKTLPLEEGQRPWWSGWGAKRANEVPGLSPGAGQPLRLTAGKPG